MRRKINEFVASNVPYFVTLICLIAYIIYVMSHGTERSIPDGHLAIYSLVVSTGLVLLGKMIDKAGKKDNDDEDDEDNDLGANAQIAH